MTYSVKVTITSDAGATVYALQVATGDDTPGNVTPTYGLADPLVVKQALSADTLMPLSHPLPDEATVTIIAPDSTTYASMAVGDPVAIALYPAAAFAGVASVEFYGRIASMAAQGHDLGVMYTLTCVDYLADLAQLQIGGTATWPLEASDARLARMAAEAGIATPSGYIAGTEYQTPARNPSYSDALSLFLELLDSSGWVSGTSETGVTFPLDTGPPYMNHANQMFRYYLKAVIVGGLLDPNTPFKLIRQGTSPWMRRTMYRPPGRLSNLAGVRTITVSAADTSPSTGAPILDGGRVEFGPPFTQDKDNAGVASVTVGSDAQGNTMTWDWRKEGLLWATGGATFGPGGWVPYSAGTQINLSGPAVVQLVNTIRDQGIAPFQAMGTQIMTYRCPFRPDPRALWAVGTLSWQAWAEPGAWARPDLTTLVTISRAVTGKLPTNREWVTGLVSGTTFTLAGGRPVLDIDLVPNTYDADANRWVQGATNGVASMDSPILSGVTIAQLSTRDTFLDYQIVRGS